MVGQEAYAREPLYLALRVAERFGQDPGVFLGKLERMGVGLQAALLAYSRAREAEERMERRHGEGALEG